MIKNDSLWKLHSLSTHGCSKMVEQHRCWWQILVRHKWWQKFKWRFFVVGDEFGNFFKYVTIEMIHPIFVTNTTMSPTSLKPKTLHLQKYCSQQQSVFNNQRWLELKNHKKDKIPSCGKIWSELIKDKANEDDEHDIADLIGFTGDDRKTRLFVKCIGEVSRNTAPWCSDRDK